MTIDVSKSSDCLVIRPLEARLDASAAVKFKEEMTKQIDAGENKLLLNLTDVEFIDSSGLGAIVSTLKMVGGPSNLVVVGLNKKTKGIFELTRMDKVFQIFESESDALGALSSVAA